MNIKSACQNAPKPLCESVLRRLTNQALTMFLGEAANYEAAARPGLQLALSNEAVADINMLVVGAGANPDHFRGMVNLCKDRQLPFLVIIFPEANKSIDAVATDLGLAYVVDFPFMVRDDFPLEPSGNPNVEVACASCGEDAHASADVLVSAYQMPKNSVLRALPATLFDLPGIDVYVARENGDVVGSVTLTYHGDICGIWAMATKASRQRDGIGLRLLSTVISQQRNNKFRRFFLGSTPVGYHLYKKLGFETVCLARIWVSGEAHQA